MQLRSVDTTGKSSQLTVNEQVFGAKPNKVLLAQAIRVYLANQRQGTSDVKTRAEVSRTTKKWFKQKGTGNARHGSRKAPIFVGGGVAHGPKSNQNWSQSFNVKAKRSALSVALSMQVQNIVVSKALTALDGKTASAAKALKQAEIKTQKVLVIIDKVEENVVRSLRNLPQVVVQTANRLTALEVAMAHEIVISPEAVTALESRLATQKTEKKTEAVETVQVEEKPVAVKKTATRAPRKSTAAAK